jgi:peroxiredoxin
MKKQTLMAALIALLGATSAEAGPKKETSGALKPGDAAPDFKLRALDGAMVRLDELAYQGKEKKWAKKRPVFLDFFRTDCEPCKKAMPDLIKIHEKYSARGVQVVLVALLEEQDGRKKLESYLASNKLPFTVVIDNTGHHAKMYLGELVTLPASFLINREGVLQKVKYGAQGTYDEHFSAELEKVISEHSGTN